MISRLETFPHDELHDLDAFLLWTENAVLARPGSIRGIQPVNHLSFAERRNIGNMVCT